MDSDRCVYPWTVHCIDRESKQMFDRRLLFDPSLCASDEEVNAIEAILADRKLHRTLTKYRNAFREVDDEELKRAFEKCNSFNGVFVDDYFEDQDGKPMNEIGLPAIISGNTNPVIAGNVSSVIRLGVSGMRDASNWSVDNSNDFVHFIQVVGILQRSRWWRNSR